MIKMRMLGTKKSDKHKTCTSCGNGFEKSIAIFDVCFQVPEQNGVIITLCDNCTSMLFDKTLKARCMVDGMIKSPNQIKIINGRKQAECRRQAKEAEKLKTKQEDFAND